MMNKVADLHEQFASQEEIVREGYVRQPFEVSGAGFEFTFSDQIVDLMEILGHCEEELYPIWQEASRSAISLGFTGKIDYETRYKNDPRLPRNPFEKYVDFPGWVVFLGRVEKDLYLTWQEASRAAIKLGLSSRPQYKRGYKQDPRLPGSPDQKYSNFPSWGTFLGTGRTRPIRVSSEEGWYPTWEEASQGALKLGIKNTVQYRRRYKEDPRLVAEPQYKYRDFPGWTTFLGKTEKPEPYPTWQEASSSAIRLGIMSKDEYGAKYKIDSKLPASPRAQYANFPGWGTFLGTGRDNGSHESYSTWQEASLSAIALGATNSRSYHAVYREDPMLLSTPSDKYPDFPGWPVFLGKKK